MILGLFVLMLVLNNQIKIYRTDENSFFYVIINYRSDKMATTKDYRDLILEQLNLLDNITCKSMMGEYLYLVVFMMTDYLLK